MVRLGSCTCARRARRRKDARGIVDRCIDGKRGLDSHRPSSSSESLGKRTWCIAPEPFPSRKSNGQGEGTAQQRRESSSRKEDDEGRIEKFLWGEYQSSNVVKDSRLKQTNGRISQEAICRTLGMIEQLRTRGRLIWHSSPRRRSLSKYPQELWTQLCKLSRFLRNLSIKLSCLNTTHVRDRRCSTA